MKYRSKCIASHVFSIMAATCLFGDGVSLAGPDDRAAASGGAGSCRARSHAGRTRAIKSRPPLGRTFARSHCNRGTQPTNRRCPSH